MFEFEIVLSNLSEALKFSCVAIKPEKLYGHHVLVQPILVLRRVRYTYRTKYNMFDCAHLYKEEAD